VLLKLYHISLLSSGKGVRRAVLKTYRVSKEELIYKNVTWGVICHIFYFSIQEIDVSSLNKVDKIILSSY
jgi:hypothetical protein